MTIGIDPHTHFESAALPHDSSQFKLSVGIDCRMLQAEQRSGVQEYTEQLLAHMLSLDKNIQYVILFSSLTKRHPEYWWLYLDNVRVMHLRWPNAILFSLNRLLNWPKLDQKLGVDVFFSPHIFPAALDEDCRRVTTFHDLSFIRFPDFFSFRRRWWHSFQADAKKQCRHSDSVIAVSKSTRNDLVSIFDCDPEKIKVIYSGTHLTRPEEKELLEFKKRKKISEPYLLYIGTLEPRKNVDSIVKAFLILKEKKEFQNLKLILAGARGWLYNEIFKDFGDLAKSDVVFVDHIDDDERALYYAGAEVFIYPSHFEGFGFPVLEAMACGTPVVTSNTSSLPEVAGDSAILVDPNNVSMIAEAVASILTDSRLRSRLIKSANLRVQQFSWLSAAQKTLETIINRDKKVS